MNWTSGYRLPTKANETQPYVGQVVINIAANGTVIVNRQPKSSQELLELLKKTLSTYIQTRRLSCAAIKVSNTNTLSMYLIFAARRTSGTLRLQRVNTDQWRLRPLGKYLPAGICLASNLQSQEVRRALPVGPTPDQPAPRALPVYPDQSVGQPSILDEEWMPSAQSVEPSASHRHSPGCEGFFR